MKKHLIQLGVIAVIYLMAFLPISFALSVSNVTIKPTSNKADIFWETDMASNSQVEWGEDTTYSGTSLFSPGMVLSHSLSVIGLSPLTTYFYQITSTNSDGEAGSSSGSFKTPDPSPPGRIQNLRSDDITKTSIKLSWDTAPESDWSHYTLYNNGEVIYSGTSAFFEHTNLQPGIGYYYQVSSWDESGNEGQKASKTFSTLSPDHTPPKISNVSLLTSTNTGATIQWLTDDNSTSIVNFRTSTGNQNTSIQGLTGTHKVSIAGLTKGETVYYKVSSCNEDNICSTSPQTGFIAGVDIVKPTIEETSIQNLNHDSNGYYYNKESIDIIGKTEGFAAVRIWRNGQYQGAYSTDENGTFEFFNLALDTAAVINKITVEATDPSGNTGTKEYTVIVDLIAPVLSAEIPRLSGTDSVKIKASVDKVSDIDVVIIPYQEDPLPAPSGVNATITSSGVSIKWDRIDSAHHYHIYRDDELIAGTSQNGFTDKDVENKTYEYQVVALDEGCSEGKKSYAITINAGGVTLPQPNNKDLFCQVNPERVFDDIKPGDFELTLDFLQNVKNQKVTITATDIAGNSDSVEKIVTVLTDEPEFTNVHPGRNDFYYTHSVDSVTISGETQGNATVSLWVMNHPDDDGPDETVNADADGTFEFEDVDFTDIFDPGRRISFIGHGSTSPKWVDDLDIGKENLQDWLDKNRFYYLQAENEVGLKSEYHHEQFEMRTCWSGNFSWTYISFPEFQSPEFVSVERLEEGTEHLRFAFELKPVGAGSDYEMTRKPIIRMKELDTAQLNNHAYNLTKQILSGIDFQDTVCDPTNTKCYVVARVPAFSSVSKGWLFDDWRAFGEALNNNIILPIEISLGFTYKNYADKIVNGEQKICQQLKYSLDNTKLDWSKLPDFLVKDVVGFLNDTIEVITDILDKAEPVIETVGYVCVGSFITYTAIRIVRTASEYIQVAIDKATKGLKFNVGNDCYKSNKDDKNVQIQEALDNKNLGFFGIKNHISILSNRDMAACYPKIYKLWQAESYIDMAARWSCDRMFCPTAPAPWTGNPYAPDAKESTEEIYELKSNEDLKEYLARIDELEDLTCDADLTTMGQYMHRIKDCKYEEIDQQFVIKDEKGQQKLKFNKQSDCYQYQGDLWFLNKEKTADIQLKDKKYNMLYLEKGLTLKKDGKAESEKREGSITDNFRYAAPINGTDEWLFTARIGTCEDNCKAEGYKEPVRRGVQTVAECKEMLAEEKYYGEVYGVTYGDKGEEFQDYITSKKLADESKNKDLIETCCCLSEQPVDKNAKYITPFFNKAGAPYTQAPPDEYNIESKKNGAEKWNYRYSKTSYIYPSSIEPDTADKASQGGDRDYIIDSALTQKREYDPNLYFTGRDQSANFGIDTFYFGKKQTTTSPKTNFVTAVQNACLTGLYKRLILYRNIATSIRSCIESAKYTGDYSSETCKDLMSRYVCTTLSDFLTGLLTGCGTFNYLKLPSADKDTNTPLTLASEGFKGVADGMGGSLTDFNNRYDNAALNDLIGGGTSGVAQKACMAALGYDWELDMAGVIDSAYDTSFETLVMSPTLRRTFLGLNVARGLPVFEYSGSVYIMPGCDIESYRASLVCVTKGIQDKYKGIKCGGASGSDACPCLYSGETVEPAYIPIQGGRITQGVPEDRSFRETKETSAYMYDHLKVELFMDQRQKESCLPPNHEDGIFYFPIADRTPLVSYGCEIRAGQTRISCSGGILDQFNFSNLNINSVDMSENAYVGQNLKAFPIITKTGSDKMCLRYRVYKGDPKTGTSMFSAKIVEITEPYSNQRYAQGLTLWNPITADVLGGTAQGRITKIGIENGDSIDLNKQIFASMEPFQNSKAGKIAFVLKDMSDDGKFTCNDKDTYSIDGENAQPLSRANNCRIKKGDIELKLSSLIPTKPSDYGGKSLVIEYEVYGLSQESANEVHMTLKLEAGAPDTKGSCENMVKIGANAGGELQFPFTIFKENPLGKKGEACKFSETEPVDKDCACGGSNVINCYASKKQYCYGTPFAGCQNTPSGAVIGLMSSSFGTPEIWLNNKRITATGSMKTGMSGIIVDPGANYNIYVSKPKDFNGGAVYDIKGVDPQGYTNGNNMYPSADSSLFETSITMPSNEGIYEITVKIEDENEDVQPILRGPVRIYVKGDAPSANAKECTVTLKAEDNDKDKYCQTQVINGVCGSGFKVNKKGTCTANTNTACQSPNMREGSMDCEGLDICCYQP